jgi:uncharacterized membrane protein
MLKLIGIPLIAIGFALGLNPLLVVLVAGLGTGLAAGMPLNAVVAQFGQSFTESRTVTFQVILVVFVIGVLERYGLQARAETLIKRATAATAGRIILVYTVIRQLSSALGLNLGGHAAAVRPLIAPMAEAAASTRGPLTLEERHAIRAHASAGENVGNFFGEDVFIAVGAVLLMKAFFDSQKLDVSVWAMALWGIPTAVIAFLAMAWRCWALDRRLRSAPDAARAPRR